MPGRLVVSAPEQSYAKTTCPLNSTKLVELGRIVKLAKSTLEPMQTSQFLGMKPNLTEFTVMPTDNRITNMVDLSQQHVTVNFTVAVTRQKPLRIHRTIVSLGDLVHSDNLRKRQFQYEMLALRPKVMNTKPTQTYRVMQNLQDSLKHCLNHKQAGTHIVKMQS